jgi:hypothetical protein
MVFKFWLSEPRNIGTDQLGLELINDRMIQSRAGLAPIFSVHLKAVSVTTHRPSLIPLTSSASPQKLDGWQNLYQTIFCFTGQTHLTRFENSLQ